MTLGEVKSFAFFSVIVIALAFFVVASSSEDSDAVVVYENPNVMDVPKTIDDDAVEDYVSGDTVMFYVEGDITVKVREQSYNFVFYVQSGKVLQLDFKETPASGKTVRIVTVAGDPQFQQAMVGSQSSTLFDGKYEYVATSFEFQGQDGMSLYYKAATSRYDVKYDGTKFTYSGSLGSSRAMVGCDVPFKQKPIVADRPTATSSSVQVAPGQTIEIIGNSETGYLAGLYFGIEHTTISGSKYTYTHYARSADAKNIALSGSESVVIKDGSATLKTGESSVKVSSVTGTLSVSVASGGIAINGNMDKGELTFSGKISMPDTGLTVKSGTKVTLSSGCQFVQNSVIDLNGTMYVKTGDASVSMLTVTGTDYAAALILQNSKLWITDPNTGDATIPINVQNFVGNIDTSGITTEALADGAFATAMIPEDQSIELDADTSIRGSLEVKGMLIVDEDVTLTVDDAILRMTGKYSQIINNGKIVVKAGETSGSGLVIGGGTFVNNGTVEFSAKSHSGRGTNATFVVSHSAGEVVNNGTFSISRNDNISVSNLTNNGTLTMSGKVVDNSLISSKGKVTFNGAEIRATMNTKIISASGTVSVPSVKIIGDMTAGKIFTVSKASSRTGNPSAAVSFYSTNVTSSAELSVRGLTFKGSNSAVDIQGSLNFSMDSASQGKAYMSIEGTNIVSDSFSTPKRMNIVFANRTVLTSSMASLSVSGSVTINKDTLIENPTSLNMTVSGEVVDNSLGLEGCNYSCAMYTNDDSMIFTTLAKAMEAAEEVESPMIGVGNTTIARDLTIPAGMTIFARNENIVITVGSNSLTPTLTIESGGCLDAAKVTLKNGTIIAEDFTGVNDDSVSADVKIEEGFSVTYKSLTLALDEAEAGDIITLNKYYVLDGSRLTIPAGITVDATADGGKTFAVIGSNLTVYGTLLVDDFYFISETNDNVKITVGGTIKDKAGYDISDKWFTPAGVSYEETTVDPRGDDVTYFVITNASNLQRAIEIADDAEITMEGEMSLKDITIAGEPGRPVKVTFKKDIDAGTIRLEYASVVALSGNAVTAKFTDEYGSITITGATVGGEDLTIYSLGQDGVYIKGPMTDSEDGTYSVLFSGKTGMEDAEMTWGNYEQWLDVDPDVTFAGDTLVKGKKNSIRSILGTHAAHKGADVVSVPGILTVNSGSRLFMAGDIDVLGMLAADEGSHSSAKGSIDVDGNIFLGATKAELYSEDKVLEAYDDNQHTRYDYSYYGKHPGRNVAAVATLSGKITLDDEGSYITAAAGSAIDESIIEDMEYLVIEIDGSEWITVYGEGDYSLDGLRPGLDDCVAEKIVDDKGKTVAKYDRELHVIYGSDVLELTTVDRVIIDLRYNVYTVMIKTDGSIKAVYIDGLLTMNKLDSNQFYLPRVKAGTHVVSVEPVAGYDASNAYLYDEERKILTNMTFSFTEDDCRTVTVDDEEIYQVTYNVSGTEKAEQPVSDVTGWNITTILLLVLVVIIAAVTVMVVLKLNRS